LKLLATYTPGSNQLPADLCGKYSDKGPLLLVMRHGRVDTGLRRCFLGRTDLPLDGTGKAQAGAWQPVLSGIVFPQVYASGLQRARQTAALCYPDRSPAVDERLNEIDLGDWDGCAFEDIRTRFPEAFSRRGEDIYRYRPPGGESFEDLHRRVVPFFEDLEKKMAATFGHVLVITHAGVIRTMYCQWAGMPMERLLSFKPAYGSVGVLARNPISS